MNTLRTFVFIFSSILFLRTCLSAQNNENITVKAGTKAEDYIPFHKRYRYPQFTDGKAYFKNGTAEVSKFNYNFLNGEIEYIQQSKDTLSIANANDIRLITISGDTFFYENGYIELIYHKQAMVAIKQYFKLKEVIKKDSYGSAGSTSATDSYSTMHSGGQSYKLTVNQDRIFQKISEFYLATNSSGFFPFTRKKVKKLYPQNKNAIDDYLKSNKVDFNSRNDLLRFAEYLKDL